MKNKIFIISTLLVGVFIMNSCLKDSHDYWKADVAGKMYAQVSTNTLQSHGLSPVPDEVTLSFLINIATDVPPTEDVTVTMKVNPDAITAYDAANSRDFKLFPNIELLTPTVVIAKGTRTGTVSFKVWGADALNACDNFIAPIGIDQVSGNIPIAANMQTYMVSLPISNPYAGDYLVNGYRKHPTAGTFTVVNKVETASTVSCSTITKSGFGDYPYDMTIEVTTNTIVVHYPSGDVTCYKCIVHVIDPSTGAPVAGEQMYDTFTGDATVDPKPVTNDVNYYNPVTKTFVLNAAYNASAPRIGYEVLVRQ